MKQKYHLIFGVIVLLGIILVSGCVKQQGGEYIPPELRPSAINIDENQAKQQVETELIKDLGQEYFISHYSYMKTESVVQNQEKVGYKIFYRYNYDIKDFEPKQMYIHIGSAGPEHKLFYNKENILNYPIVIVFSDTKTAESDCSRAFSEETRKIINWSHSYFIYTYEYGFTNPYGETITLISTGQIENTNEVISCEFNVTNGNILTKSYGTKVTPIEPVK